MSWILTSNDVPSCKSLERRGCRAHGLSVWRKRQTRLDAASGGADGMAAIKAARMYVRVYLTLAIKLIRVKEYVFHPILRILLRCI